MDAAHNAIRFIVFTNPFFECTPSIARHFGISGQEAAEVRFDVSEIDLFCNYHINPFPEIPECVSNLVYKLDLACFEPLDECHIKALISSY